MLPDSRRKDANRFETCQLCMFSILWISSKDNFDVTLPVKILHVFLKIIRIKTL